MPQPVAIPAPSNSIYMTQYERMSLANEFPCKAPLMAGQDVKHCVHVAGC
jgi:hypothetical protein